MNASRRRRANGQPMTKVTAPPAAVAPDLEPETLVLSHVFDVAKAGEPYSATLRLHGRRVGARGKVPRDAFARNESIDDIVPGSGPVSITTWIPDLTPGEWTVRADLINGRGAAVLPAAWSWRRWAVIPTAMTPVKTRWAATAPLARQPAVLPGSYLALALVGFAVALLSQAWILGRGQVEPELPLAASFLALGTGLIGARVWYAVLHHGAFLRSGGWAVDGFLVVAPLAALAALHVLELPIAAVLDAATPGIFWAVAIGRIGCFLVGCCAGRPTRSRFGIWSSDRRVGARRIPTQLLEAGAGLLIGLVSLVLVVARFAPIAGAVFMIAFAAYALIRQGLLRLRAEHRESRGSLPLTAALNGAALLVVTSVVSVHTTV